MFEFITKKGIAIDGSHLNVLNVGSRKLTSRDAVAVIPSFYYHKTPVVIFDVDLGDAVNTPIVGVSLYSGIGYAQLTYKSAQNRLRARIWLAFNPEIVRTYHANFRMPDGLGGDVVDACTSFFDLSIQIYDAQPTPSNKKYGLKVYASDGELVFDSNYAPMKIGVRGDINNGNHVIFVNRFLALEWLEHKLINTSHTLDPNRCNPFMVMHDTQKVRQYDLPNIAKATFYEIDDWLMRSYYDWIEDHTLSPIIGYI